MTRLAQQPAGYLAFIPSAHIWFHTGIRLAYCIRRYHACVFSRSISLLSQTHWSSKGHDISLSAREPEYYKIQLTFSTLSP